METPEPVPSISPAKQDRILIWRSEVELATITATEPDTATTHDGASSRGGSSAATSTTTSSRFSSRSAALVLARGRHALAKVTRRLAWPKRRSGGAAAHGDGLTRTAMYARLSPDYRPADGELESADGDVAPLRRRGEPAGI